MAESKIQQLAAINQADYKNTYAYVEKCMLFFMNFRFSLIEFLGADQPNSVQFLKPDKTTAIRPQDAVTVDPDAYLRCPYLITINNQGMNINNCGIDFIDKGLAPLSGIILQISILLKDGFFQVKAPSAYSGYLTEGDQILSISANAPNYEQLLNNCWESAQVIVSWDLNHRIERLMMGTYDDSKDRAFGFQLSAT